eukprot:IDg7628t1
MVPKAEEGFPVSQLLEAVPQAADTKSDPGGSAENNNISQPPFGTQEHPDILAHAEKLVIVEELYAHSHQLLNDTKRDTAAKLENYARANELKELNAEVVTLRAKINGEQSARTRNKSIHAPPQDQTSTEIEKIDTL